MSSDSPPPQYSPPRPPPPYSTENKDNENKERKESTIKISPAPFIPLSAQPSSFMPTCQGPNVVYVHTVKEAMTSAPYQTFCPKCQIPITTRQHFVIGTFTWILVIIILIVFFPLAFVPFCLDSCKDVQHHCPKCNLFLSYRRKFR